MPIRLKISVEDDASRPSYGYEFDGDRSAIVLGRRGGVDVLLPHPKVSMVHARIERRGASYSIIDEGSTHGTRLNGIRLRPGSRAVLRGGDRIGIGEFVVEVSLALTELDGPGDNSRLIARRMVRDVLERLGPKEAQPRLEPVGGGPALHLPDLGRTYILGFAPDGRLALDTVDMWREHVALERQEGGVTLRPVGPGASARVGGSRVDSPVQLHDGVELGLGDRTARFFDPAEAYLRRLEVGAEPVAHMGETKPRPTRARPAEVALFAAGLIAILLGGAGLVWVARW